MIVPNAPGGGLDMIARLVAERMREKLGQPVVVENVPTAAGTVGVERAARALPDGYTIVAGDQTSFLVSGLTTPVRYDVLRDFEPIALLATSPPVLVARTGMPDSLREVITRLRASPGSVTLGTFGKGSGPHILAAAFESLTRTRLQIVPYRGVALALQDLIGGRLDLQLIELSGMLAHLRTGQLKSYGVLSQGRSLVAPDVPTIDEAGGPQLHVTTWRGLWAPKATPKDVIAKLNTAVVDSLSLSEPDLQRRAAELGQEIVPHDRQTPEALGTHHKAEMGRWLPMIQTANARGE
jgi:tripartite-type tricarboxylate transporter receptor subunit TctC